MQRFVRIVSFCLLACALLALSVGSGAGAMAPVGDEPPPLFADFDFSPLDPTRFEAVGFVSLCYAPDGALIEEVRWDFGDGSAAEGGWPAHQYAADGDYAVTHTCSTADGRTASATKTVAVRTHDVEVVQILAPRSAKVGQTRLILVEVRNTRYDETVRVGLWRSAFPGTEEIASATETIGAGQSRRFTFNYTFTEADAAIGKVTFMAFATLVDVRDAIDADNMLIAPPAAVNP